MAANAAFAIYKPKNQLGVTCDPITEVHTSGTISGKVSSSQPYMFQKTVFVDGKTEGSISSTSVVKGYDVKIRYEGRAIIGENLIFHKTLPNYMNDPRARTIASQRSDIRSADDGHNVGCCDVVICCAMTFTGFCLCVGCFLDSRKNARHKTYTQALNNAVNELLGRDIAGFLKQADEIVGSRIAGLNQPQQQQGNISPDMMRMFMQMQMMQMQQLQAQQGQQGLPGQQGQPGQLPQAPMLQMQMPQMLYPGYSSSNLMIQQPGMVGNNSPEGMPQMPQGNAQKPAQPVQPAQPAQTVSTSAGMTAADPNYYPPNLLLSGGPAAQAKVASSQPGIPLMNTQCGIQPNAVQSNASPSPSRI